MSHIRTALASVDTADYRITDVYVDDFVLVLLLWMFTTQIGACPHGRYPPMGVWGKVFVMIYIVMFQTTATLMESDAAGRTLQSQLGPYLNPHRDQICGKEPLLRWRRKQLTRVSASTAARAVVMWCIVMCVAALALTMLLNAKPLQVVCLVDGGVFL